MTQKEFDLQMSAINQEQAQKASEMNDEMFRISEQERELQMSINELYNAIRDKKSEIQRLLGQRMSIKRQLSESNREYHARKHDLNLRWQQEYVQQ